jgi:hypothetical protein
MVEVVFPDRKCMVRVALVDVGPGENALSHADVDLTSASDQFPGTQGGATVRYQILVPSQGASKRAGLAIMRVLWYLASRPRFSPAGPSVP